MFKTILASALVGSTVLLGGGAQANSIIENHQNRMNVSPSSINQPTNGGTTTLTEKCEALQYFQNRGNFGKIFNLGFQIGFEHETGQMSVDEACSVVGINTY